ncbi:TetR/AcrR family transcriptional regulator [Streptomyces sp. NPDC052023]|uniref:TetR/AcrR family transcriptional regulator n=1 Tax=Streptomyces sp. NPDC052023 TaxID=3365681 RepID=UPI0037D6D521
MVTVRSTPAGGPLPGLRERKKIKTRESIRSAAFALVGRQGYDATTIEQIAERAEVSPSTVLRYFPAKEDIVLCDEQGAALAEAFRARPAGEPWPESLRHVVREAVTRETRERPEVTRLRCRLMAEVPMVRSRMLEAMAGAGHTLAAAVGERSGRDPESLEVRVFAMSLVGGLAEAAQYWARTGFRDDPADLADRALAVHHRGLGAENP